MLETVYPGTIQQHSGVLVFSQARTDGYAGPPVSGGTGGTPASTGAAPKMINLYGKHAQTGEAIVPSAGDAGTTPVIYYADTLTGDFDLSMQFQVVERRVIDKVLDDLGSLFGAVAGDNLPIFQAGAKYFLAGEALKVASGLEKFLDPEGGKEILKQSLSVHLSDAGFIDDAAGFKAIYADSADSELANYCPQVIEGGGGQQVLMADTQQKPYAGDTP